MSDWHYITGPDGAPIRVSGKAIESDGLLWAKALKWLILLAFVALVIFLNWEKLSTDDPENHYPNAYERRVILNELFDIQERAFAQIDQGEYSAEQFLRDEHRIIELKDKAAQTAIADSSIGTIIREKYKNWLIDHFDVSWLGLPDDQTEILRGKWWKKKDLAIQYLNNCVREAESRVPPPVTRQTVGIKGLLSALLFFVKGYLLFVPFAPFWLMVQFWERKKSFVEVFQVMPMRTVFAGTVGWLVGLNSFAEAFDRARLYREAEREFLQNKPIGYQPSKLEQQALWQQALRPAVDFQEAWALVTKTPYLMARQSRFAAVTASLCWSIQTQPASTTVSSPEDIVIETTVDVTDQVDNGVFVEAAEDEEAKISDAWIVSVQAPVDIAKKAVVSVVRLFFGNVFDPVSGRFATMFADQIQPRGPPRGGNPKHDFVVSSSLRSYARGG